MKASTIQKTAICEYCGCSKTYRTLERKQNAKEHLHTECGKLKKLGLKFEDLKK